MCFEELKNIQNPRRGSCRNEDADGSYKTLNIGVAVYVHAFMFWEFSRALKCQLLAEFVCVFLSFYSICQWTKRK